MPMSEIPIDENQRSFLISVAHLVWWKSPEDAIRWPEYLLRQVMCLGDLEQTIALEQLFPKSILREVLLGAEPGQMNERSWNFWYSRLFDWEKSSDIPTCPRRSVEMFRYD